MSRIREIREAHDQLMGFMRGQVAERKAEIRGGRNAASEKNDAFTMLVKANEDEAGKLKLDDQELVCTFQIAPLENTESLTSSFRLATFLSCCSLDMVGILHP